MPRRKVNVRAMNAAYSGQYNPEKVQKKKKEEKDERSISERVYPIYSPRRVASSFRMMRVSFSHLRLRLTPFHRGYGVDARIQLAVDRSLHTRSAKRYKEVNRSIALRPDRIPVKRIGGSTELRAPLDEYGNMSVRLA